MGIRIDHLGVIAEGIVDGDDFPAHRGEELGCGLHRLDRSKRLTRRHVPADVGQLHVDDVAELVLRVIRDADLPVSPAANPLVILA